MKMIALALAFFLGVIGVASAADVAVSGYFRSDGTYVQPHFRTAPNDTVFDNYSTKGMINPYTGKAGTVDPYGSSNDFGFQPLRPLQPLDGSGWQAPCYFNCQ